MATEQTTGPVQRKKNAATGKNNNNNNNKVVPNDTPAPPSSPDSAEASTNTTNASLKSKSKSKSDHGRIGSIPLKQMDKTTANFISMIITTLIATTISSYMWYQALPGIFPNVFPTGGSVSSVFVREDAVKLAKSLGRKVDVGTKVGGSGAFWELECEGETDVFVDGCTPTKCGRYVVDDFVSQAEVDMLISIADKAMTHSRALGGPCIFDIATGATTHNDRFISVYNRIYNLHIQDPKNNPSSTLLNSTEFETLISIYHKIYSKIVTVFNVSKPKGSLRLSKPSFFSRIDSNPPKTPHDEYWHTHIDREQYGSFCYTGLLYLSNSGKEFKGGDFVWRDLPSGSKRDHDDDEDEDDENEDDHEHPSSKSKTLQHRLSPRAGRLSLFTSGDENLHHVAKVTKGVRKALTVAFTCSDDVSDLEVVEGDVDGGSIRNLLSTARYGIE
ncbi:2-oxoglutarate and iron-dependent oxygenase domain-containing protein 3 [Blyttiomyces sp. JEL0837]|nr:2-oxoglutarate and iron-dependent oxygenase domain-containing protein 3 [Blyttiomyces sp. JEL0837]